jgi:hypothetical protein
MGSRLLAALFLVLLPVRKANININSPDICLTYNVGGCTAEANCQWCTKSMLEDGVKEDGVKMASFSQEVPTTSFCASQCSEGEVVDSNSKNGGGNTATSNTAADSVLPIVGVMFGILMLAVCVCVLFRLKSNLQTRKTAEVQFSDVSSCLVLSGYSVC